MMGFAAPVQCPRQKAIATPSSRCRVRSARARRAERGVVRCADAAAADTRSLPHFDDFERGFRGEWPGFEVTLDTETGAIEKIPMFYVPEEFQTWNIHPNGFESNNATTVRGSLLYRKHTRVLPSISHFGDHIDVEDEVFKHQVDEPGFQCFACGSYSLGPTKIKARESLLDSLPTLELCLVNPGDREKRVLIVARLDFAKAALVDSVQMILEKRDMDFADGQFVDGGSGFRAGWGDKAPMSAEVLKGKWQAEGVTVSDREGVDTSSGKALFAPDGIHVLCDRNEDGVVWIELGWLADNDTRAVIRRGYSAEGELLEGKLFTESRVSQ